MEKKYQVFVSSTYDDLKEERAKVIGTLLENNCIPIGMEQFPSSDLSQWDYIKSMIDMSDYHIVIVAGRYGSIDPETKISYTEREYRYAHQRKIPILTFLHENPEMLPVNKSEETDEGRAKLKAFRNNLQNNMRLVKFYSNIDDLSGKVATSINQAFRNTPRNGWIRSDHVQQEDIDDYFEKKIKQMTATDEEVNEMINEVLPSKY